MHDHARPGDCIAFYPMDSRMVEMMLSHIISGGFRHPNRTFFFYDQIRSAAVHGEEAPAAPSGDAGLRAGGPGRAE